MTVKHSPRPLSVGLPDIPEEQDRSLRSSAQATTSRSATPPHPTEYHQSFRTRGGPRPRNPGLGGWQARNLSNILPSGPERPSQPARAGRRPPPEALLARQAQSQIFPLRDPPPLPNQNASTTNYTDVNNNPRAPPPIAAGGRRRTGRWPWQARAQRSSIFLGETENVPRPATRAHHRYPWQERAQRSVIFEVLTGQDPGPKRKSCRTYDWDQRQSKLVTELVQQKKSEDTTKDKVGTRKDPAMPWKERAMQSVVFRSPDEPTCPRPVNYVWDQRRTRFSVQPDPTAQFAKGSSYKDNYVKWQGVEDGKGGIKAAGKPCYTFDDVKGDKPTTTISPGGGKRRFKKGEGFSPGKGEILALPAPPPQTKPTNSSSKSTSSRTGLKNVKGTTCLEIVPLGYSFSNRGMPSETKRN